MNSWRHLDLRRALAAISRDPGGSHSLTSVGGLVRSTGLLLALGLLSACTIVSIFDAYTQYEPSREQTPIEYATRIYPLVHLQYADRSRGIQTVAVMPPDAKVYDLPADDRRNLMDEWSAAARKNLEQAVVKEVGIRGGFRLKAFETTLSPVVQREFEDVRPLFETVALTIIQHSGGGYGAMIHPEGIAARFEYTLGPVPALAEAAEADALLFLYTADHVSSGGRIALRTAEYTIAILTLSKVRSAPFRDLIVTALIEGHTGDILWFNVQRRPVLHYDLRDPASAESTVREALGEFERATSPGPLK